MNLAAADPEVILVDGREARAVSALERGLHYGDGLFETIGCTAGRPRLLPLHLMRLARGCQRLRIAPPDPQLLGDELAALAGARERSVLKLIVTRGPALARGYAPTGGEQPTRVLLRYAWPALPAEDAGVRVRFADLKLAENPALAGIKHLNRLEQVLARAEWSDPAIAEALLFSRSGHLISGTMSNVFLVRGGTVMTPDLALCGVEGVMRQVVLQAAAESGIAARVCALAREDLDGAEEIFLTNALHGIRPVAELAGRSLGVGGVTRRLQTAIVPQLAGGYFALAGEP